MLIENQHPDNKSILISVLGAPNVGKSSLINYLLGLDLSIVTGLPQTTRNKFNCIFKVDHTEVVLVDTPGLHRSNKEFNKRLNQQAKDSVDGADLVLMLIDLSSPLKEQFENLNSTVKVSGSRIWGILTKSDIAPDIGIEELAPVLDLAKEYFPTLERSFKVSTKTGENMHQLIGDICDAAEPGPHLYGDEVSNRNMRFFASEYIREQAFKNIKDEIPFELAVLIEEYKEVPPKTEGGGTLQNHISASILVNRPSQRAIVIGSGGSMIKKIGTASRLKLEAMTGGKVHLNLHVKVSPKWFKNNTVLEELGLPRAVDSSRVWRARD